MENQKNRLKAVGLKWRPRAKGRDVPYWVADEKAVKLGFPVQTENLDSYLRAIEKAAPGTELMLAERALIGRCDRLQAEMQLWLSGKTLTPGYDGTFASAIDIWQRKPESAYHLLKPTSRRPYDVYAKKLKGHIGELRIDKSDGLQVIRWFNVWAGVDNAKELKSPKAKLPAARMAFTVLKEAISFGIICRHPGCAEFMKILDQLEFPSPRPRDVAPTAAQIIAARRAAHAEGRPSRALAYALQFEPTLRQWDVIGTWVPISDPRFSQVLDRGMKWIGPTWNDVDDKLILRLKPSKTEDTTAVETVHDLSACPMVVEELQHCPAEKRHGPLIVNEATGLPYRETTWRSSWRRDARAAKIPDRVWNRDLRAGGNTEAQQAKARVEDRAKVAGHSERTNARVYSRDTLEAHRRVMKRRAAFRAREK